MAIDNELLEGINLMKTGNEAGFNALYSKTYNFVYAKARFIMKDEQDALDLTQETYVQAYKGIASLDDASNIYAWLGAIVYNQGMRIFRKKKEILLDEGAEGIFDDIVSEDTDLNPEESADAKETVDIIKGFIEELPELQKIAVLAFYYDNIKIDDIATICDCSPNTIKSRLNYAKKFLKDKVEEHEKKNNYKLHSFTPGLFVLVLKTLLGSDKYRMSAYAAEGVFSGACAATGMSVAAGVSGSVVTNAAATASVATKVGLGIGAKIAIAAASISLVAASATGIFIAVNNEPDTTSGIVAEAETTTSDIADEITETPIEEDTTTEEPTSDNSSQWNVWNLAEGQYRYTYVNPLDNSKTGAQIYIGNIRNDSPFGPLTVDIDVEHITQYFDADIWLRDYIAITDAVIENGRLNVTEISENGDKWMMNFTLLRSGSFLFSAEIEKSNGMVYTYNAESPTLSLLTTGSIKCIDNGTKFQPGTYRTHTSSSSFPDYLYDFTISIDNLVTDETTGYQTFDLTFISGNTIYVNDPDADMENYEYFSVENVQYAGESVILQLTTSKNAYIYCYIYPTKTVEVAFGFDVPERILGDEDGAYYTTYDFAPYYTGTATRITQDN